MSSTSFLNLLQKFKPEDICFVGLGNKYREDDAAGLILLKKLRATDLFKSSYFIDAGTTPENYLQTILDSYCNLVVFIDIAHCGNPPGEINLLDSSNFDTSECSTHAYSLKLIERFLKLLNDVEIKYLVIEPETTKLGQKISQSILNEMEDFINQFNGYNPEYLN